MQDELASRGTAGNPACRVLEGASNATADPYAPSSSPAESDADVSMEDTSAAPPMLTTFDQVEGTFGSERPAACTDVLLG